MQRYFCELQHSRPLDLASSAPRHSRISRRHTVEMAQPLAPPPSRIVFPPLSFPHPPINLSPRLPLSPSLRSSLPPSFLPSDHPRKIILVCLVSRLANFFFSLCWCRLTVGRRDCRACCSSPARRRRETRLSTWARFGTCWPSTGG